MGTGLITITALAIGILIYKTADPEEKRFLAVMFIAVFLVRIIVAVLYQWYIDTWCNGLALATDESYYMSMAWYKALLFKMKDAAQIAGEYAPTMDPFTKEKFIDFVMHHTYKETLLAGGFVYSFILSFFCFAFGYSVLVARFFNTLIGTLTILTVYFLAKRVFNKNTARLSLILLTFMPAHIFLSISVVKDMSMAFMVMVTLHLIYNIKDMKDFTFFSLPLALVLYLALKLLPHLFYFLLALLGICMLIKILDFKKRRIISFVTIAMVLAAAINPWTLAYLDLKLEGRYYELFVKHITTAQSGDNTSYRLLPDRFYTGKDYLDRENKSREILYSRTGFSVDQIRGGDALSDPQAMYEEQEIVEQGLFFKNSLRFVPSAFLKGLFYALFKPFPWEARKLTQALASVQMVIWYVFFPFVCAGLYHAFRGLTKDRFILVIFFFGLLSGIALGEGNVGALFRHRELFSFAYVIFAAAGLVRVFSREKKIKL